MKRIGHNLMYSNHARKVRAARREERARFNRNPVVGPVWGGRAALERAIEWRRRRESMHIPSSWFWILYSGAIIEARAHGPYPVPG